MPFNGKVRDAARSAPVQTGPAFPTTRMRRNRRTDWSRRLTQENVLTPADFIWPIFVREGDNLREPVDAMPGVVRYSCDTVADAVGEAKDLGIPVVAIFPFIEPDLKDAEGSISVQENNLVCRAIRAIKAVHPDIGVQCDVALDPFTSHGHDGLLDAKTIPSFVENSQTHTKAKFTGFFHISTSFGNFS